MLKYLLKARYDSEGIKRLVRDGGTSRREAVDKLITSLGGKVEAFYFTVGECDAVVLFEAPDNKAAIAGTLIANATGLVHASITPLLTVEDVDAATRISGPYRAPGQ